MRPGSSLREWTGQRVEPGLAVSEDAATAQAPGAAQGRHLLRFAASLWPDGDQERREPEAFELVHGACQDADDGALHYGSGADSAGAAWQVAYGPRVVAGPA